MYFPSHARRVTPQSTSPSPTIAHHPPAIHRELFMYLTGKPYKLQATFLSICNCATQSRAPCMAGCFPLVRGKTTTPEHPTIGSWWLLAPPEHTNHFRYLRGLKICGNNVSKIIQPRLCFSSASFGRSLPRIWTRCGDRWLCFSGKKGVGAWRYPLRK